MSEIDIREFVPEKSQEDADSLLPAFLAIWNEPENRRFLSLTQKPFYAHTVKTWFSNHLGLGGHYYAAVGSDRTIRGIAVIKTNDVEGFEIIGIGVRPECQREGVCTKLLKHVVNVAADSNFKSIEAVVFADNAVMLRLLLSMSFVPAGMDYNRRCDGADTLRMKKVL